MHMRFFFFFEEVLYRYELSSEHCFCGILQILTDCVFIIICLKVFFNFFLDFLIDPLASQQHVVQSPCSNFFLTYFPLVDFQFHAHNENIQLVATTYLYQDSILNMANQIEELNFKFYLIFAKFKQLHQAGDYHIRTTIEFIKSKHRLTILLNKNPTKYKLIQYTLGYI